MKKLELKMNKKDADIVAAALPIIITQLQTILPVYRRMTPEQREEFRGKNPIMEVLNGYNNI